MDPSIGGQPGPKRRRCKCKYKIRWFYSKGAFLVLVWVLLSTLSLSSFVTLQAIRHNKLNHSFEWLFAILVSVAAATILLLGWLANTKAKLGVYKVAKFGFVLLFLATFITSVATLFLEYDFTKNQYITNIFICSIQVLYIVGAGASIVSTLHLGLDQMPDASSSSITSFVAWLVFNFSVSKWIIEILFNNYLKCLMNDNGQYPANTIQLWSLFPVSCMSIVIVTDFLFAKKWLIILPKSSHTLRIAYQVLKFAAKHKAPLNRSALTYWEEDIPSRMDLGKLRYGGPFTTEQVEDVKTVLRLLVISLPLWVLSLSVSYGPVSYKVPLITEVFPNSTSCSSYKLFAFTYKSEWWALITAVLNEFVIYPLLKDKLPSILKRIGMVAIISFVLSVIFLILTLVHHFFNNEKPLWVVSVSFYASRGVLYYLLFCAVLELVCAQAPYNMKGFFTGYFTGLIITSFGLGSSSTGHPSHIYCSDCILFGVKSCVSLFGFVLYCLLAHWYKKRVRDEEYNAQTVVEEVYDRYLNPSITN
ncbi:solute carrier family 15 member 4-like isoform X1 [Halichondria panicea]|uniref:solute carrier family 15 member 4-like isoform X1 n=1 Tax=Halichondria panicea TaxID=6063 RepID=UPI00312B862E